MKDIEKIWMGSSGKTKDDTRRGSSSFTASSTRTSCSRLPKPRPRRDGDKFTMVKDGNTTLFKYQPEDGNPVYGTVVTRRSSSPPATRRIVATALKQADDKKKAPISADAGRPGQEDGREGVGLRRRRW